MFRIRLCGGRYLIVIPDDLDICQWFVIIRRFYGIPVARDGNFRNGLPLCRRIGFTTACNGISIAAHQDICDCRRITLGNLTIVPNNRCFFNLPGNRSVHDTAAAEYVGMGRIVGTGFFTDYECIGTVSHFCLIPDSAGAGGAGIRRGFRSHGNSIISLRFGFRPDGRGTLPRCQSMRSHGNALLIRGARKISKRNRFFASVRIQYIINLLFRKRPGANGDRTRSCRLRSGANRHTVGRIWFRHSIRDAGTVFIPCPENNTANALGGCIVP